MKRDAIRELNRARSNVDDRMARAATAVEEVREDILHAMALGLHGCYSGLKRALSGNSRDFDERGLSGAE
jgi:hypothetical protein